MNTTLKELKTMMNKIITTSENIDTDYHVQFRKHRDHHEEISFHISVCFFFIENEKESSTTVFLWDSNSLEENKTLLKIVLEAIENKISIPELRAKLRE